MSDCPAAFRGICWPSREQRRLLELIHLSDDEARRRIEPIGNELDLNALDGGSLQLMPLLGYRLAQLAPDHPLLPRLRGAARYHWCKGQVALRHLDGALRALRRSGVVATALKGLAVRWAYPATGLRPMNDVDLLVPCEVREIAVRALQEAGWHAPKEALGPRSAFQSPHAHAMCLVHDGTQLDLHWYSLLEDRRAAADCIFFQHAQQIVAGNEPLYAGPTEAVLLHVLVHGARFSLNRSVNWVNDATYLIRHGEVDWELFEELTCSRQLFAPVLETSRYLHDELGLPVPRAMLAALHRQVTPLHWAEYARYALSPRRVTSGLRASARLCQRARHGISSGVIACS